MNLKIKGFHKHDFLEFFLTNFSWREHLDSVIFNVDENKIFIFLYCQEKNKTEILLNYHSPSYATASCVELLSMQLDSACLQKFDSDLETEFFLQV